MEQLNKVELRGVVGNSHSNNIVNAPATRFSVATDYAFKDKGGNNIIETTWHSCVSFDPRALDIKKGDKIHLFGRLRNERYMDAEGNERAVVNIYVNKFEIEN